ncbi:SDR family oxidoreductase [Mycetocola tolaasinivorans]|uniref:SDR family oxidoreductase n=1 Tax=Mycetocola tolaasinivorans TaxID=76635 RepID=A0A3L7A6N7_9MICO|nr:SDR family oxidoreductase [Mycetocola tolaasinivorans]RLP75032.1 SDR family oxidoreductase [Mycetocola tolaasinivorans]
MSSSDTRSVEGVAPRPRAIVTGATGGMGAEIVRDLSRTHDVIALGRSGEKLAELALLPGVDSRRVDLARPETIGAELGDASAVDVLVHAAAIGAAHSVETASPADWAAQLTLNVVAAAELTRILLPTLRERAGTVIFIGSGASTRPVPGSVVYAASKHALRALADTLRIDEEPHRIRVATVAPGQTDTEMLRSLVPPSSYTPERYIQPSSVAAAVRFVVDAPADVQLTDIAVRPRQEIARL